MLLYCRPVLKNKGTVKQMLKDFNVLLFGIHVTPRELKPCMNEAISEGIEVRNVDS